MDEASARYRVHPVMSSLAEKGSQCDFRSSELGLWQKLSLLIDASSYDVVFIQRKLFSPTFIKLLRGRARKLVFDFDDAIFVKSSGHPSPSRLSKFKAICEAADLVIGGNAYLVNAAREAGAGRTRLIPTSVSQEAYESVAAQKTSKPTLVWIGSSSTRRYLDLLTPVLDWVAAEVEDVQLKVIADFEFRLESMPVINAPWQKDTEVMELASSHIGIAPMINDAWTEGKCALKVLQYMAAGLPVISSACGANQQVIDEGATGYLAVTDEDWVSAVKRLAASEMLRQEMGEAGRRRVAEAFDLDTHAQIGAELLLSLVD